MRAHVTNAARDLGFARRSFETARGYADVLAGGEDPYDYARGAMVKAYRCRVGRHAAAVRDLRAARLRRAPAPGRSSSRCTARARTTATCSGASSASTTAPARPTRRPRATSCRSPRCPAIVVAPYGRGEVMGYDGLGEQDVLRVLADVRRAYKIDPERVSLTGLSMGGGGTWTIGLRHPELFAALAPVCGVTDVRKWIAPAERGDYDEAALEALSPPAFAENAAGLRVFIFHGDADPVVPVADSRRMAARFKALGWLGKTVTYTEYPGVDHHAWTRAYAGAELLRTLAGIARDPKAPQGGAQAVPRRPRRPRPLRQEPAARAPAPLRLRHARRARGRRGGARARRGARRLGPGRRARASPSRPTPTSRPTRRPRSTSCSWAPRPSTRSRPRRAARRGRRRVPARRAEPLRQGPRRPRHGRRDARGLRASCVASPFTTRIIGRPRATSTTSPFRNLRAIKRTRRRRRIVGNSQRGLHQTATGASSGPTTIGA